ncbi:hypothetical protein G4B88_019091 [Cannabis sativa]|uniref:Uncharacterized protein n=1 Tax=Cannabis sativa TaxID=3483 RepID=A0A7J6H3B8_CANSA|nr:hypothetical protein G4B88_019091 [Cannabis sativa]
MLVSFQSVVGLSNNSTRKLKGHLSSTTIVILIDSRATNNFISKSLVATMAIPVTKTKEYGVTMGNDDSLKCEGVCKNFNIHFQGVEVWDNFLPLQLRSTDVILGLQSFTTLGTTKTNSKSQTMKFQLGKRIVIIKGEPSLDRSLISLKTMIKTLQAEKQGLANQARNRSPGDCIEPGFGIGLGLFKLSVSFDLGSLVRLFKLLDIHLGSLEPKPRDVP